MGLLGKIQGLKIFEGIDTSVVEDIVNSAQRQNFIAGEVIMEQGDHPSGTGYIIEHGSVKVLIHGVETASL